MSSETKFEADVLKELELFRERLDEHLTHPNPEADKAWKTFRLRRGVYGQKQDNVYMLRIRVAFGRLYTNQLRTLAHIVETYSKRRDLNADAGGVGHITTRQAIQIHFAKMEEIPDIQRLLAEVGLTGYGACGDAVRNIVAPSLAGVDPSHPFDVTPYADWVDRHVLRNPELEDVPRKFKIGFAGSEEERSQTLINDIGFEASINEKGERGFRTFLGGGLGVPPTLAKELYAFVPEDQILALTRAILDVFIEFTERKNRKKMRFKSLIQKHGWDQVVQWIEERFEKHLQREDLREMPKTGPNFEAVSEEALCEGLPSTSDKAFEKWLQVSVHPQIQIDLAAVRVRTDRGDFDPQQWRDLADFAERWGKSEVRTDRDQNVLVPHITKEDLHAAYEDLRDKRLLHIPSGGFLDPVSCPGGDTCNLAVTRSRALSRKLEEIMEAWAPYGDPHSTLRVSGCPNSCGQHMTATIGFWGTAKRVEGKLMPCYELMLGGGDDGNGNIRLAQMIGRVPSRSVPDVLEILLAYYLENRKSEESIPSFFARSEKKAVKELLSAFFEYEHLAAKDPNFFKEFYTDRTFAIKQGESECA